MFNQLFAMLQYSILEFLAVKINHSKVILIVNTLKDFPIEVSMMRKLVPHQTIVNLNRFIRHLVGLIWILIADTMIIIASCSIRLFVFVLTLSFASLVLFIRLIEKLLEQALKSTKKELQNQNQLMNIFDKRPDIIILDLKRRSFQLQ